MIIAVSSYSCIVDRKCRATSVHGALLKFVSVDLGLSSTCTRYTFFGTSSISFTASSFEKLTCPETNTGYLDVIGRLDPLSFPSCCIPLGGGGGGGGSAMVVVDRWIV